MPQPNENLLPERLSAGTEADSSIPPNALDQALEQLLEEAPAIYLEPSAGDLASAPSSPPSAPPAEPIDPLNPRVEVWESLEQAARQAEEEVRQQAHHHRLTPPEELPDISNL